MLLTAEATLRGAALRAESRGAHQRDDFPETDPAWQRTIVVRSGPAPSPSRLAPDWGEAPAMLLTTEALPLPSDAVAEMHVDEHLEHPHKLLE